MKRKLPLLLLLALPGCADAAGCGGAPPAADVPAGHVLLSPDAPALKKIPPDTFDVRFETTQGVVVVRVYRDWAPLGAYRFYNLARNGFYDGSRFFRVLPGFAAQFGLSGRPQLDQLWSELEIPDDPGRHLNLTGTLSYAKRGPDSRSTQLFFNYRDNEGLDHDGFVPIGRITEGMSTLYLLYSDYGDTPPAGNGPAYGCILTHGNAYLDRKYPRLDRIERATVIEATR